MEEKLETEPHSAHVDFAHDTSVPVAHLAEFSSAYKLRERDASNSMEVTQFSIRRDDSIRSANKKVSWSLEIELRIALTTLMNSESAEPFLCDDFDHGLLGLRTVRKRLAEGRYVAAKMFWSDIDECLSICATIGRHPFMVWEMRALFLQLKEDLTVDGCLKEVSPALRSVATPTCGRENKTERCYESGTRRFSSLAISKAFHAVPNTLQGLEDRLVSTGSVLVGRVCDTLEASSPIVFTPRRSSSLAISNALLAVPNTLQGPEDKLQSTGSLLVDMLCDARDEFCNDVLTA